MESFHHIIHRLIQQRFSFAPTLSIFLGKNLSREREKKTEPIENKRACYHKRWNCCYKAFRSQFSTVFMLLLKLSCLRSLFTNTKGRRNGVTEGNKRADQERTEYREVVREQRGREGRKKKKQRNLIVVKDLASISTANHKAFKEIFFSLKKIGPSAIVATKWHAAPIAWAVSTCHNVVKWTHSLCFLILITGNILEHNELLWLIVQQLLTFQTYISLSHNVLRFSTTANVNCECVCL